MKIKNVDGQWTDIPKVLPCPDCGRQVSTKASMCPSCGRKLKEEQTAIGLLAAIIIGLGLAIGVILFMSAVMQ
jgi:hypothetical protein